jgi:acetylornithine deacetylase
MILRMERSAASAGGRAVDLLETLVGIPSVTGQEGPLLDFLEARYRGKGFAVEPIAVSGSRRNLFVHRGPARVVLSAHADTVPPFLPPRRQGGVLFARGACDAKGSLAAQAVAFEDLVRGGAQAGLLVLVGEERGSDGALAANREPRGSRYIVCGEPTENRFATGSKGCLRVAASARGVAGHSSIAGSARSAVEPLLDFLNRVRAIERPADPVFGETTMNIGVLEAGTAPNVIAEAARAEILLRTGEPVAAVLGAIKSAAGEDVALSIPYRSDPIRFRVPRGSRGEIVAFACDLPLLAAWGEPILVGPGSIRDAHAAQEKVELSEIEKAVSIYRDLASGLLEKGNEYLEPDASFMEGSPPAP